MNAIIVPLLIIMQYAFSMQEEHTYEIAHSQELPYKVHCQNGIVNLSEYEWILLKQSSKVIQDASDSHNNDDEEIALTCIKRSTLTDLIYFLKAKPSSKFYNLSRMHKLLLGTSYLEIYPEKIVSSIVYLKQLLSSAPITNQIAKDILFSVYAFENRKLINDPVPIVLCTQSLKYPAIQEAWGHYLAKTGNNTCRKMGSVDAGCRIKIIIKFDVWVNVLLLCNNTVLASGDDNNAIKLWDRNSNECIETLRGHTDAIRALVMTDDNILASGSSDTTIKLWNLSTKQCIATLYGHTNRINTLAMIDNNILASGSGDTTIKFWDLSTKQCLTTLNGHTNRINTLAMTANNILASGSDDTTIKLWDLSTKQCITTLNGHTNRINTLAMTANNILISGSDDTTIKFWTLNPYQCIKTLKGHNNVITSLKTWENILVSTTGENAVKHWDISAFNPEKDTPAKNALMRTLLKNKDNLKILASILQDPDWKAVYNSLPDTSRNALEKSVPLIQSIKNLID